MAKPYAMDLGERAMARLAAGEGSSRVAAALSIAVSSVIKWAARARRLGSVTPGRMGGHRPFAISGEHRLFVLRQIEESPSEIFLVRLQPSGWSHISKQEIRTKVNEGKGAHTLRSVLPMRQLPVLHPDHLLDMALRYANQWPLVPVVSRADLRKLEGVISEHDILNRYRAFDEEGGD